MKSLIEFISPQEEIYTLHIQEKSKRGILTEVHIADIHFGSFDPAEQYKILREQFLERIVSFDFDILSIDGDLFDHKFMSNSDVIMYATNFFNDVVEICKSKNATLVLIHGTTYHDSFQFKMFYHYLQNKDLDLRIIENTKFEYIKGAKILCIPEQYGMGEDYYNHFLFESGLYDSVFMHGTIHGAVYQAKGQESGINSDKAPTFTIDDFGLCRGPILSGHVHNPGCFNSYFYYCGSPYRWKFGEEQDKGFLVVLHNLDTQEHYTHFETIESFRYDTINLDDMIDRDPKEIIKYINDIKEQKGIDFIRIEFSKEPSEDESGNLEILKNYYKSNSSVKLKIENFNNKNIVKVNADLLDKYKEYDYILDKSLSEYDILTRYINQQKGYEYITVDELKEIISETF